MQAWPATLTRVPYWVYQDPQVLADEQQRIFEGPVWNFLCLEMEIPNPGDWRATHMGAMPVVAARDLDGGDPRLREPLRAPRRADLHRRLRQRATRLPLHLPRLELRPEGQPDRRRLQGRRQRQGRHADKSFRTEAHGPRKLRTAVVCGLVFGTLSADAPPIEEYLGDEILGRMQRVLNKPLGILGSFTQALPNNWKLYIENVKDTYHASLLHTFFATFRITRLSQGGGVIVSRLGRAPRQLHHRAERQSVRCGVRERGGADQQGRQLPPGRPDLAREHRRVRRRHPAADPVGVPGLRAAADPQLPGGAAGAAEGRARDRAQLDLPRLRRRHARAAPHAPEAGQPGRAGGLRVDGGRRVGGFVQRGTATAAGEESVVEMGGERAESQDTRATEASVRGFWKAWRACMGV